MPNNYEKMTPEQLRKLYDYNNRYSKEYYKNLVVKLDKRRDGELISFVQSLTNKSGIIRDYLESLMKVHKENGEEIRKILDKLNYHQQLVVRLRYGLDDGIYRSAEDVAKEFNISIEMVTDIENSVLNMINRG